MYRNSLLTFVTHWLSTLRLTLLMVALASLVAVSVPAGADQSPGNVIYERVVNGAVTVYPVDQRGHMLGKLGSGVVIGPTQVVTNCHVMEDRAGTLMDDALLRQYVPATGDEYEFSAVLGDIREDQDLCVLHAEDLATPPAAQPVEVGQTAGLAVGDDVYALGAPGGFRYSLSKGVISQFRACPGPLLAHTACAGSRAPLLQFDAKVGPGSSGGGLYDDQGALIGIVTMAPEGQFLAVPVDWVKELREYSVILRRRAQDMARDDGDIAGALELLATVPDQYIRGKGIIRVAMAQAERGDRAGAARTLEHAIAVARTIDGVWDRDSVLRAVSYRQSRIGEISAALNTAWLVAWPRTRARAFWRIAGVECRAGNLQSGLSILETAVDTVPEIQNANDRARRLAEITGVLAKCGDLAVAWSTLLWAEREVRIGREPATEDVVRDARRELERL